MSGRRYLRPLLYSSAALAVGGGAFYISYRPRNIPGSDPAAVPPPRQINGGVTPPTFPYIKSRDEQIADLKRSGGVRAGVDKLKSGVKSVVGAGGEDEDTAGEEEPYDLLIVGGGATGSGIALDAATRGLRVACVERDDFSSGTSSKSTKLVHGGVRYLEKAVWELDYNQCVFDRRRPSSSYASSFGRLG